MGQYQQPYLNQKGCVLELAQRNSQVSIPFAVSSLGYGFLWNNPAVGKASFGFGLFFISINTDLSDNLCFLKVVEIFPKILLFGSAEAVCGQFL